MANIYVTIGEGNVRDTFMPQKIKDRLASISMGNVQYNSHGRLTEELLAENLADTEICVTGWGCPWFTEKVLNNAGKLKLIAHIGGSVANHVGAEVFERGIKVTTGNDIFAAGVAEGTLAYMLAGLRRLVMCADRVQQGMWWNGSWYTQSLFAKTVGLVGFGAVSRNLVPLLRPFGCEVIAYDPFVGDEVFEDYGIKKASLLEIAEKSEIVSVHASKTEGSRHIIDREFLRLMKDGALLVNTARGSVIDEQALADEAVSGRINLVLDVFEKEPLPKESRLRNLENVILIPHMAGPTVEQRKYVAKCVLDDIEKYLKGEPMKYEVERTYALRMTKEG